MCIFLKGKLVGIGVGPGSPDLLTIRAVNRLREADVLIAPQSKAEKSSVAMEIVKPYLSENIEILTMEFPMTRDRNLWREKVTENAEIIKKRIDQGQILAFVTLGDAMLYSTFINMFPFMSGYEKNIETVPGVTSYSAVAASFNLPLAEGEEPLVVVPLKAEPENLDMIMRDFTNVVVMKPSHNSKRLSEILKKHNLEKNFVLISNCGMENENISTDISILENEKVPYLSTLIVKKH